MLCFRDHDQKGAAISTGAPVDEARSSLPDERYWKIHSSGARDVIGVPCSCSTFNKPQSLLNPAHNRAVRAAQPAAYQELQTRYDAEILARDVAGA